MSSHELPKKRTRLYVLLGVFATLLIGIVLAVVLTQPTQDDRQLIEGMIQDSVRAFNNEDYRFIAELSWPQEQFDERADEIESYAQENWKVQTPVEIRNVIITGSEARVEIHLVVGTAPVAVAKIEDTMWLYFVKRDEQWWFDWAKNEEARGVLR